MKNDHRVRLTKMLLHRSLLSLMRDRPFAKITVKEICERADINRATFYAHYAGTEELLLEIKTEVAEEILRSVNNTVDGSDSCETILEICQSILKNREYCEVLFGQYGDEKFLMNILDTAREQSVKLFRLGRSELPTTTLDRVYTYIAHGSVAIIRHWVQSGMKETPSEIAEFIEKVSNGVYQAV